MDSDDFEVEEAPDALKSFLPTGFGKHGKDVDAVSQIAKSRRPTEKVSPSSSVSSEDEDNASDSSGEDSEDEFPVSHELVLKTHEKAVTTLTLDNSGSRLISGSADCTIKLHDFASMTPNTLRAFKSVDPSWKKQNAGSETHPIHHVEFNPVSPASVLVVTATSQAKIFDRDGELLTEFAKGDMYLRDMHNTKGHVSEITTGVWHPTDRNLCLTAATDSTVRIWDVNHKFSQKEVIVHKSKLPGSGGRTRMTAVAWSSPAHGGPNIIAGAAVDGSVVIWSGDGPHSRPAGEIQDAHRKDTWTSGIAVSGDGRTIVTRGGDDTIKLWDTRKFKTALTSVAHPSTSSQFPNTNVCFSPSSDFIITGSATGHLHILNPATLKAELVTPVSPGSPLITLLWHKNLNQILTGSADASTHVLYNPSISTKGAAMVMSKAPKRRHIDDDPSLTVALSEGILGDGIVNPHGILPGGHAVPRNHNIGLTASGRSRDPRRPHVPQTTPFAKSQPDQKHVRESIPLSSMRDEDPREALLRYADRAKDDPMFTKAWSKTQPVGVYREASDHDGEEDEDEEQPDKKKRKV